MGKRTDVSPADILLTMKRLSGPQRRVKTCSPLQRRRRDAFIACVVAWKEAIAQGKCNLWTVYALRHPVQNKKAETVTLFGWSWFLKINIMRIYNGLEPVLDPPSD